LPGEIRRGEAPLFVRSAMEIADSEEGSPLHPGHPLPVGRDGRLAVRAYSRLVDPLPVRCVLFFREDPAGRDE
jgi:hypothetical protein